MKLDTKNNCPLTTSKYLIEYFNVNSDKLNQKTDYSYNVFCALKVAETTRNNLPMYKNELNPKWEFWNEVVKELKTID